MLDARGRVVLMNRAARSIWDLPDGATTLAGHGAQLRTENGDAVSREGWPTARAWRGEAFVEEEFQLARSSELLRIVCSGSAVRDSRGDVDLAIVTFRDVTELRHLEQMREEYAALISHDLRTPLTAILGQAQLLRRRLTREDTSDSTYLPLLDDVEAAARRMNDLVQDLLESSYLESNRMDLSREPTDVRTVIAAALAGLGSQDRITVELPDHLPAIDMDGARVERIVTNLLTNARKYSPADSPVVVTVSAREDEFVISVTDQGRGIAPEEMARLFSRFYRIASSHGRIGGYGLGLYISRLIVEAHGGRIWVESEPGEGSTFSFTLPANLGGEA